jgi:hypothetical protein
LPTTDPAANRVYCRAYHQRLKQNPAKYAARLEKIRDARLRRSTERLPPRAPPTGVIPETPAPLPAHHERLLPKADASELFQERAAIMQFDGGLSEATAEARALADLLANYTLEELPTG